MQSNDDLQPFFGLIASTVERSQLEKQIQFQGIPCVDQSSSDEEDLESSPSSKSDSSRTKELESSETSREWMFTGHWYFQNTYGALPDVEIEQDDKLEEMWGKMGAEIKSAFLTMLHVTPEYIVVVSNPAEIIVDEDASEIILPLRGYIAAKRTSRESWQRFRQRKEFEWTKITGGIRFWPQFMHDEESVLDEHDHFTVLTEWGSRKFFDVHGRAWAFTGSLTVPPRKTSDCDLLQMTRDAFGAVAERPSSGIRYLCVHCDISALMQTDDAKEAEVPVRGFLQTTKSRMSKWEAWLPSPCEWRPMRGGLGGNKDFEGAEIEARSADSQWVSLLVEGTIGRNNALRLADAMQASALPVSVICHFIFEQPCGSPG